MKHKMGRPKSIDPKTTTKRVTKTELKIIELFRQGKYNTIIAIMVKEKGG